MTLSFLKPNALVYVCRTGLIVAGNHIPQARLAFPPELVNNLEVLNQAKFIEHCRAFFEANSLTKKRVRMVLDGSVVFRKNVSLDNGAQSDPLTEEFIAAIPFEAGQRACLSIRGDNVLQLLATNADLYQAVSEALKASGVTKVVAIVPSAAFDIVGTKHDASFMIERFCRENPVIEHANFALAQPL